MVKIGDQVEHRGFPGELFTVSQVWVRTNPEGKTRRTVEIENYLKKINCQVDLLVKPARFSVGEAVHLLGDPHDCRKVLLTYASPGELHYRYRLSEGGEWVQEEYLRPASNAISHSDAGTW